MNKFLKEYGFYVAIWSYILAFILTFGYSFNQIETDDKIERASGATLGAFLFPLYWSVKIFED